MTANFNVVIENQELYAEFVSVLKDLIKTKLFKQCLLTLNVLESKETQKERDSYLINEFINSTTWESGITALALFSNYDTGFKPSNNETDKTIDALTVCLHQPIKVFDFDCSSNVSLIVSNAIDEFKTKPKTDIIDFLKQVIV